MIYTELNEHTFAHELSSNKDNGFSYNGARELYNYLININYCDSENMNMPWIEFDAVALRCEYTEYNDLGEYIKDYCQEEFDEYYEENEREDEGQYIIEKEFLQETLEEYIYFEDDILIINK